MKPLGNLLYPELSDFKKDLNALSARYSKYIEGSSVKEHSHFQPNVVICTYISEDIKGGELIARGNPIPLVQNIAAILKPGKPHIVNKVIKGGRESLIIWPPREYQGRKS